MLRLHRSGLTRAIALFLLLAGGTLSSLEFALHGSAVSVESVHHVAPVGSCLTPHHCLGTAMSGAGITPKLDARTLVAYPEGLEAPVHSTAAPLAFLPAARPTTRAPPTNPV